VGDSEDDEGCFEMVRFPVSYLRPPFIFQHGSIGPTSPAPCLGQHNEYVYKNIVGLSDDEFIQLLNDGVFD